MKVPFFVPDHASSLPAIESSIREIAESGAFVSGRHVSGFEADFAAYCTSAECTALGSGTEALWLALHAIGVQPGDEVITVPNSFIATAEAISFCQARPVFVDVEESTYGMNPALLEAAITPRTRAIIPVHLFGQMADMEPILSIATKAGIPVIEDACQAHGAEYKGRRAGSMGDAGAFSFYPSKNLGAFGEAGAVVTGNAELAQRIRMLRDHGQSRKYEHRLVGWNGRMDEIQGAVLRLKLRNLEHNNERRRQNAALYGELLGAVDEIALPREVPGARHVYHIYAIRTTARESMARHLQQSGIGCGIHYPVPIHLQECFQHLGGHSGDFPVAERAADELLSLPMFPDLTPEQIQMVAACVKDSLSRNLS
jgi:dTDP-4-amino-4,6-dideoxygalactose transaminase